MSDAPDSPAEFRRPQKPPREKLPLPTGDEMRFKCVCAYDGTDYCGWQSQPSGGSVQDFIERRLEIILKRKVRVHGSGRTDAGVHANAQVFHFDAPWGHGADTLLRALNGTHTDSVRILKISEVSKKFHARFSVKGKRYVYKIFEGYAPPCETRYVWSLGVRKVDVGAMSDAAQIFVGTHDFTSFSANRGAGVKENTVKTIFKLDVKRRGKHIAISTRGSGYLYKMVRMLVGALVAVGAGKITKAELQKLLDAKIRGSDVFQTAPAQGLFLDKVFYK